ncbi:F0F1 ATP synthase subunit B [Roseitalea porphyridii]|uniref:ATP synthase subunit b n=1 Tax=Roseitalea porphyridii TaxID=1852022 RepID=A0A4P6UZJ1_9HYPH|nr:F0F1 ATP synthase subunit B [Roseitalea porphyridii]QBK29933.1 F0F1 ATP synthase subunit B [Roseitalea porphyridii]
MFVTTALAATTEAAQEGSGAFPPFDSATYASQLFWLAITFGIFYWFIARVISPRIGEILETRQDRIAGDLDMARDLQRQADEAHAAYEQELAQARSTAGEIGQKARDKAKAEAEAERQKVEADLAKKLDEAEKRIASIREKAMAEVGTIAGDTTGEIVDRLVGAKVSKDELAKAIETARR